MRLREVREAKAHSQRSLSRLSGVAQDTISDIERGLRKPHPGTIRKLATALDVDVEDITGGVSRVPKVAAPPSLTAWLEERCGHAYLALPKDEFEEMFDRLPEESPERREIALAVNREYNVFCKFPSNVTTAERVAMRRMIRDAIPQVAVKHGIALMEGGLVREYQEEAARIFEVERATESDTA